MKNLYDMGCPRCGGSMEVFSSRVYASRCIACDGCWRSDREFEREFLARDIAQTRVSRIDWTYMTDGPLAEDIAELVDAVRSEIWLKTLYTLDEQLVEKKDKLLAEGTTPAQCADLFVEVTLLKSLRDWVVSEMELRVDESGESGE